MSIPYAEQDVDSVPVQDPYLPQGDPNALTSVKNTAIGVAIALGA